MKLEQGDVLVLDKNINERFNLMLAGKTKFLGKPGIVGKKVAVQITDILKLEEEGLDGRK